MTVGEGEIACKRFLLCCCLSVLGLAGAYSGVFYVTGSQFYEACQQREAKEKIVGGFNEVEADNPSQAALWASCTPIMGESMENAGFAIGSPSPQATEDAKALASACPDATEMPSSPSFGTLLQSRRSRRMEAPR